VLDFPFMAAKKSELTAAEAELRKIGMAFPEATEDFPWGHRALKVKGKAFVFMSNEEGVFSLSVKLPDSADFALMQPFAQPTGYGLGKSGWVSASFGKKDAVPVQLLGSWLRESYLAIAPKKLAAQLRTLPAKGSQRPKAGDAKPVRTAKAESKAAGKKTVKRKK
jgi:predicted DNA-binding protein (MmcQ/YjbR family)